jgi:signal peptidase
MGLKLQIGAVTQVNSVWLPLLCENLLASVLARLAGAKASLSYRAVLAAFWWFCPVLPDLSWALKGLIGAAVPIVGLMVVNGFHAAEANRGKPRRQAAKAAFPTGWVIATIGSVALVWFAVGLFPLQPTLVPSGSMIPVFYPGDVVIVAKAPATSVRLGDIIEYRNVKEKINIVHRVIEIHGDPGQADYFITKGDNNSAPDVDPVTPEQVIGKVVFTVPKVGYVSIAVKQLFKG